MQRSFEWKIFIMFAIPDCVLRVRPVAASFLKTPARSRDRSAIFKSTALGHVTRPRFFEKSSDRKDLESCESRNIVDGVTGELCVFMRKCVHPLDECVICQRNGRLKQVMLRISTKKKIWTVILNIISTADWSWYGVVDKFEHYIASIHFSNDIVTTKFESVKSWWYRSKQAITSSKEIVLNMSQFL